MCYDEFENVITFMLKCPQLSETDVSEVGALKLCCRQEVDSLPSNHQTKFSALLKKPHSIYHQTIYLFLCSNSNPNNMDLAPLRSLDDFILQGSRFQVPDINQPDRCFNRIVNNLLYYQTNYFLSGLVIFLLVTFLHPQQMALGIILLVSC